MVIPETLVFHLGECQSLECGLYLCRTVDWMGHIGLIPLVKEIADYKSVPLKIVKFTK